MERRKEQRQEMNLSKEYAQEESIEDLFNIEEQKFVFTDKKQEKAKLPVIKKLPTKSGNKSREIPQKYNAISSLASRIPLASTLPNLNSGSEKNLLPNLSLDEAIALIDNETEAIPLKGKGGTRLQVKKSAKSSEDIKAVVKPAGPMNINLKEVIPIITKYSNSFPLGSFLTYLKTLESSPIQRISFSGMESVTDLAFFVMNKHLKGNKVMWKDMDSVNLDSCRYITDFGIEMLNDVLEKKIRIQNEYCCGCEKLFKTLYTDTNEKNDIFTSTKFTKSNDSELPLKSYKLLIINDTDTNLISYLRNQTNEKHDMNKFIYSFGNVEIEIADKREEQRKTKKREAPRVAPRVFNVNIIEANKECPAIFYSQSSILSFCMNYDGGKSIEKLTMKLLNAFNTNVDFLSIIILMISFQSENIKISDIINNLTISLNKVVDNLTLEENAKLGAIDGMNFQERERYRDVVRLKFSIKKFLQKINDLSFCMH